MGLEQIQSFPIQNVKEESVAEVLSGIGEQLRRRRLQLKLSQADISKACGYRSAQMVSNWERGLCGPPLRSLEKIRQLLQFSREDFLDILTTEARAHYQKLLGS